MDSIPENSLIGYILEVDLEYPEELHDLHNDYLLCPEHIEVSHDMLSGYCKDIADCYNIKNGNLIYYLSLGIKLTKIHRILSFKVIR